MRVLYTRYRVPFCVHSNGVRLFEVIAKQDGSVNQKERLVMCRQNTEPSVAACEKITSAVRG